jgi:prepilin-type N-terminal cleavage/methylation domain-containing protein/prepilin-type processing-associated H-X9-DG protein
MKKRSGFTLIELLVVIAIIAILASILFPVFARARENARRSSCLSNVKQIGLGFMQYTQDYDEKFPPAFGYTDAAMTVARVDGTPGTPSQKFGLDFGGAGVITNGVTWMDMIFPYVKSVQIFVCPSERSTSVNTVNPWTPRYGYNNNIHHSVGGGYRVDGGPADKIPVSLSAIQRSAELFLIMDYQNASAGYASKYYTNYYYNEPDGVGTGAFVAPHLEGANYAYADGHAKWTNQKSAVVRDDRSWDPNAQ